MPNREYGASRKTILKPEVSEARRKVVPLLFEAMMPARSRTRIIRKE